MEDPWAAPSSTPWEQRTETKQDREAEDPWATSALAPAIEDDEPQVSQWEGNGNASWEESAASSWDPEAELELPSGRQAYEAPSWSPKDVQVGLPTLQLDELAIESPASSPPDELGETLPLPEIEGFGQPMELPPIPSPELPSSPVDDEGFGGFSSADAGWANEHNDGQQSPPMPSWGGTSAVGHEEGPEGGEGWGGVTNRESDIVPAPEDQEWELAQERLRRQQEKAPAELVSALREAWTTLAKESSLPEMPVDPKLDEERGMAVEKMQEQSRDTIRSLASVPSDINTYPTVLSSTQTHQRFRESLARTNAKASSSFLARPARRQARGGQSLSLAWDNEWTVRSKLGEPEAQAQKVQADGEVPVRPGWGFWGRKSSMNTPQVLTTSGGGLLEVKADVASPTAMAMPMVADRPQSMKSITSRPASPGPPAPVTTSAVQSPSAPAPAPESISQPAAGPSAVSRFFGRLSRKPASQRTPSLDPESAKDLELSHDDFSFLAEVPSIPRPLERGTGDLLMMEGGRTEEMASLENMLNSKATPLPAPLAPPPRGGPSYQGGAFGGGAAPKVVSQRAPASDMDLLSDMELSAPIAPSTTVRQASQSQGTDWDAFLTASPAAPATISASASATAKDLRPQVRVPSPVPQPMAPVGLSGRQSDPQASLLAQPAIPAPPSHSFPTMAATQQAAGPSLLPTMVPMLASAASRAPSPLMQTPRPEQVQKAPADDFGDFGDFGGFTSSKPADADGFDDFGDFAKFSSPPAPAPLSKPPFKSLPVSLTSHTPSPVFNTLTPTPSVPTFVSPTPSKPSIHDSTLNLINNISGRTGRWPAPASPVAPAFEPPPPKAAAASQSFFKLPPPPSSSRAATPLSQGFDAFGFGLVDDTTGMGLIQPTKAKNNNPPRVSGGAFDLI